MTAAAQPVSGTQGQRIDKWLWYARVIKTRTMAADLVLAGKVRLNRAHVEKPSQHVKPGDVLTIPIGNRVRILEVRASGTRRGPAAEAQELFTDLTPPPVPRDPNADPRHSVTGREAGSGRPTKRDRRLTDKLQDSE